MSDISQRDSSNISHSSNIMQQKKKKDNEVTDSVPISSFNLIFAEQQNTSSRTPQSRTVILLYKNKRNVKASISYWNRRSDPSMGVEYMTFLRPHVSHAMGAVESAMVIITLNMCCCCCMLFVLNCYFDVFEFVVGCGLGTCIVILGCCVLNCYFDNVEFDDYVDNLCFVSSSFQHLLSTKLLSVDLTMDEDV
ncbi:hypothetical protein P9112_009815 [Eukaryota sp. TZLM1-RC]